jgi:hypothetical protein
MSFITVAVGLWLTAFMDWGCCLKKRSIRSLEAINAANAVDNYSFMKTSTVKQSSKRCLLRLERSSDCDVASEYK